MGITDKLKDFILPEENEQEELELTKEEASMNRPRIHQFQILPPVQILCCLNHEILMKLKKLVIISR